jgi:glycosyltransferase involved in cell wall biosynthesis
MTPLISVIVPVFNLGRYLPDAIESVLAQKYQHFEILVVDDGSTEPETLAALSKLDGQRQIRVFHRAHQGLARTRNFAIEQARGSLICALDCDDRLHPTYFSKAVDVLASRPEIAFVSCWLETFGAEKWVWEQNDCSFPALLNECTVLTAALVRRDALMAVGGYDTTMCEQGYEDWDLWISLVEKNFVGTILPEVLFYYRRRVDSMSATCTRRDVHVRLLRHIIEKHIDAYRAHRHALIALRERAIGKVLAENFELETRTHSQVRQKLRDRRAELARLEARLGDANRVVVLEKEIDALRAQLSATENELAKMHESLSWKVTSPARSLGATILSRTGLKR